MGESSGAAVAANNVGGLTETDGSAGLVGVLWEDSRLPWGGSRMRCAWPGEQEKRIVRQWGIVWLAWPRWRTAGCCRGARPRVVTSWPGHGRRGRGLCKGENGGCIFSVENEECSRPWGLPPRRRRWRRRLPLWWWRPGVEEEFVRFRIRVLINDDYIGEVIG